MAPPFNGSPESLMAGIDLSEVESLAIVYTMKGSGDVVVAWSRGKANNLILMGEKLSWELKKAIFGR